MIIVGGNHDSPSRLQAPAEVLRALNVHVVGGIGAEPEDWSRCLVPLRDADGIVQTVILAVPYVHEFRLGVRTTDLDDHASRAAFIDAFSGLYRQLVDRAHARFGDVPVVATGHLTIGTEDVRPSREDYPQEIHRVGQIDALPPSLFDPRIAYVALGHIHRCYPIDPERRIWYSGSPLACSLPEARRDRRVLQVDLFDGVPRVHKLTVPPPRNLRLLSGTPAAVKDQVRRLAWDEPLPPLVFLRIETEALPSNLISEIHDALAEHPVDRRPQLVEWRHIPPDRNDDADEPVEDPALDALRPAEVFARLCEQAGVGEPAPLQRAFADIETIREEDLQGWTDRIRQGVS